MLAHEQLLGTNRDGSAAVDSSRALLLTLLGEFVLPIGWQCVDKDHRCCGRVVGYP